MLPVKFSAGYIFLFVAGTIILTLSLVSGCLYHQNEVYRYENRQLILQNDSVLSVNIELKNLLNKKISPGKTSSVFLKEEKGK